MKGGGREGEWEAQRKANPTSFYLLALQLILYSPLHFEMQVCLGLQGHSGLLDRPWNFSGMAIQILSINFTLQPEL